MDSSSWTTVGAVAVLLIKNVFDQVKADHAREQDRKDRAAAAALTAQHREMMSVKLDENTLVSSIAAEKADVAANVSQVQQASLEKIQQQTNGMQEKLMELSRAKGFREGQADHTEHK